MPETTSIIVHTEGPIGRITLNRPNSLNALNEVMIEELHKALLDLADNDEIKVIIVNGAGRAFSAGVDLKTTSEKDFRKGARFMELGLEVGEMIHSCSKVTIAQVHGFCFTGALELMLFFDLAYCSDSTQFGDTHAKWGIMPRWGMTQRLARRVGLAKAKELSFRAHRVRGDEAERIQLVNKSFSKDELEERVYEIALEIAGNSHEAIIAIKRLYNEGYLGTFREGLILEHDTDIQISSTADNIGQFEQKKFKK